MNTEDNLCPGSQMAKKNFSISPLETNAFYPAKKKEKFFSFENGRRKDWISG
jgi:hypothetical protein